MSVTGSEGDGGQPPSDEVLRSLAAVLEVLETSRARAASVDRRARELRAGRLRGDSYAELLTGASGPLIIDVISELLDGLSGAGSRLRRAEARALHAEGMSMDKIGLLMRVSRQRVSAIINSPFGQTDAESGPDRGRSPGLSLTDAEFRMIAESLPHLVWIAVPDGSTEYFNQRGIEYTAMPRETNDEWNWLSLVHPDDRELAERSWAQATQTESPFEVSFRIRRFDGEFRWHRFGSLPVRGSHGAVTKWIGTATDIGDQKALEAALHRAEREASRSLSLLEALCADAQVGFGLVDDRFRVVRMNRHLAEINGAPVEDQIGYPVAELVPDLWPALEPALREVRETGEAVLNLPVRRTSDQHSPTDRQWLASYYPVRLESDMVGIGLVIADAD